MLRPLNKQEELLNSGKQKSDSIFLKDILNFPAYIISIDIQYID